MRFICQEVERALVALPDFKSGAPGEQPGGWVRFPCTSAIFFRNVHEITSPSYFAPVPYSAGFSLAFPWNVKSTVSMFKRCQS